MEEPKINMENIYAKCPQMQRIKNLGSSVGYAVVTAAVSIIKRSEEKDYSFIYKNNPHAEVIQQQIKMAAEDEFTDNPLSCDYFYSHNPEGCDYCSVRNTVRSPIQLGIIKE